MVVLLDGADLENATAVAQRLCKTMADKQFELAQGLVVNVTISLGVATYPIHGKTSTDLIEFADRGLYNAKKNGRNQLGALPEVAESV
jgi:diguanylate cyclase (GGDEF)-like protein